MKISFTKKLFPEEKYIVKFPLPDLGLLRELRDWCTDTYGPQGHTVDRWAARWEDNLGFGVVTFKQEADLTMFLLRWS